MASRELEEFVDETIAISAKKAYFPTAFIGMRKDLGTVEAISRLVVNADIQSGFSKLKKLGLIEYTIEAAVMKFPADFSPSVRECAAFRLRMADEGGSEN